MRLGVVVVSGLALGVLTSYGQTYLPDALRSVANSAAPWSVVAFGLALLARRAWTGVAFAVVAFAALLLGYDLASQLRFGYGLAAATWVFWLACTIVVGPVLGALAPWARRDPGTGRSAAVAVVCGLLVGEGVHGVVSLPTTSPVWWSISIALGVAGLLVLGCLRREPRQVLLAVAGTVVVGAVFVVGYRLAPGLLG